ncbi:glycosyltransferase family 2 protein [Salinimicrobium sp. CDJ15-81-2]|nr:glycosyltransferase family 2 protein [Salinimicrobium nanhaiense]
MISIIIPTFNRAHFLGETLESIIDQTFQNWECIVVDDGSTDATSELMEFYCAKDRRFKYYHRPGEMLKGPSSCRNFGFKKSGGEWIKWFDSDDILLPFALEKILKHTGAYDLIISSVKYIDEKKQPIDLVHRYIPAQNLIEDYFVGKISYYTSSPTWNRIFLEKQQELFDEKIRNFDDWDFNLRMIYQKPKVKIIEIPLLQYRLHTYSLSKEIDNLNFNELKSEFYARKKHLKVLQKVSGVDLIFLKKYDRSRCKRNFRQALVSGHRKKFHLYIMLSKRQIKLFEFKQFFKFTLGYMVFSFFRKGEKLLR